MDLSSYDLVDTCRGLTYRKLDHWCRAGVFGAAKADMGSGTRRTFDEVDTLVARVLGVLSNAFDEWSGGRGGMISLYTDVAAQIRQGERLPRVQLTEGVFVTVDVAEMRLA